VIPPGLVVCAPVRGPQGLRVAPLLAALARLTKCWFLVAAASERDLAPGRALTLAEWLDQQALDTVAHLYILADDAAGATPLRAAHHRPGVTLLQDPGLAVLHQSITLDSGEPEAWVRAMAAEHGGAGRRLARAQLAGLFSKAQRHWTPMLDGLADAAPLLVVRSRHAAGFLPPGARHVVLPESTPEAVRPDQAAARAALGLGPGPLLLVPLRAPAPLTALREIAAQAGAVLLPSLPADDLGLHVAACDAALALSLPFGGTPLHKLAAAMAAGRPVLAWEADPAAEMTAHTVAFPADGATLAEAIRGLLADGPCPPATPRTEDEALALLSLIAGCRFGAPAP
jgi:hypothetical protein